jgi:hypothetical protein
LDIFGRKYLSKSPNQKKHSSVYDQSDDSPSNKNSVEKGYQTDRIIPKNDKFFDQSDKIDKNARYFTQSGENNISGLISKQVSSKKYNRLKTKSIVFAEDNQLDSPSSK